MDAIELILSNCIKLKPLNNYCSDDCIKRKQNNILNINIATVIRNPSMTVIFLQIYSIELKFLMNFCYLYF
jgi:hypothetical protein